MSCTSMMLLLVVGDSSVFFCVCKKYAASRDKYSRLLSSVTGNVLPPGFSSKSLSRSVRETAVQKFAAIQHVFKQEQIKF